MADYNRIIMIGNLTRDPELKTLPSGQSVCKLGLAANRQFRNSQTGQMVQEVCFVDIDVWGRQAESCNQYLQKGRPVLIEGRLKFEQWTDNNGNNRSKHTITADRVVFLSQQAASEDTVGSAAQKDPSSDLERELLSKIDKIKEKASQEEVSGQEVKPAKPATLRQAQDDRDDVKPEKKTKAKTEKTKEDANNVGDVKFQDEPPFEDNLPF